MVRDQANKTLEIFMQRVRKYAQTLPETTQPPASTSNASAPPRMGTPSAESSWAGWAISSFTNKLASVNGDMSTPGNGAAAAVDQRPSSVPASAIHRPPSTSSLHSSAAPAATPLKSAKPNPFSDSSLVPEVDEPAEDFGNAWDDSENPWGGNDEEPFSAEMTRTSTSDATFDDKGEPDFAGWLNAQSQAKSAIKRPLPKGLAKAAASNLATRPSLGKAKSTDGATAKRAVPLKKPAAEKKVTPKPAEEEEEGWGDEWA
jgi:SCY1-like protein 1